MKSYTSTSDLACQKQIGGRTIVDAYGNWLETMEPDYFGTFTTKKFMSIRSAESKMEGLYNLIKAINHKALMFWVAEPFDVKEGCHTHALIKCSPVGSEIIKEAWETVSGSKSIFTEVKKYEKERGANFYIAKYLERHNVEYGICFN